ncbi:unnamed protein product [Cochlearia groenlandica]
MKKNQSVLHLLIRNKPMSQNFTMNRETIVSPLKLRTSLENKGYTCTNQASHHVSPCRYTKKPSSQVSCSEQSHASHGYKKDTSGLGITSNNFGAYFRAPGTEREAE